MCVYFRDFTLSLTVYFLGFDGHLLLSTAAEKVVFMNFDEEHDAQNLNFGGFSAGDTSQVSRKV